MLLLTHGPVTGTVDQNSTLTSLSLTSASSVDLCAVLADP
jgi:hypothetical protein